MTTLRPVSAALFHFSGDLAFFRGASLTSTFDERAAAKDVLEAIGVPHPEIDLVLMDGNPLPLEARIRDGATLEIFPARFGPEGYERLLPPIPQLPRFVLDGHLGRLASLLRMLGFDTTWERNPADEGLAQISSNEDRVLLTRDLGLLKRTLVRRGAFVRATQHLAQGREIVSRFSLQASARPFTRCLACNGLLAPVSQAEAIQRVPQGVLERHVHFLGCVACSRLYWSGTHHAQMKSVVAELLA